MTPTSPARLAHLIASPFRSRVVSAAAIVGVYAVLSRTLGAGKDVIVAWLFGTSDSLEAFLFQLSLFVLVTSNITSAIASVGTPFFVSAYHQDDADHTRRFVPNVILLTLILGGLYAVVLALLSHPLLRFLAGGFSPAKLLLTEHLLLCLLPALPITALSATFESLLNARERFGIAAAMPSVQYATFALVVVAGARTLGVNALVLGQLLGATVELCVVACAVARYGTPIVPRWHGLDDTTRSFLTQIGPYLLGGLSSGINPVIDHAVASHLAPGSVASLAYGYKIVAALLGMAGMIISTPFLRYFSELLVTTNRTALWLLFRRSAFLMVAVTLPLTACLILLADPLVGLVFQHGAFTHHDRVIVSHILRMYALQIPFFVLRTLVMQLIYAMNRAAFIGKACVISFIVNASLDWVFMRRWGISGIALSTSCVVAMDLAVYSCFLLLNRRHLSVAAEPQ